MKSVGEKIVVSVIVIVATFLFIKMRSDIRSLSKKGVYVVGKLNKSYFGGADLGWIYEYEYFFDGKKYIRSFTGPLGEEIPGRDSLLFFRILPTNPKICRQLATSRVPDCYRKLDLKTAYWKKLFKCSD